MLFASEQRPAKGRCLRFCFEETAWVMPSVIDPDMRVDEIMRT